MSDIADFTHTIQVDEGVFLGASGGIDDFVNHSCEPNCGLRSANDTLELVALKEITPGDEITFDYSTCIVLEPELKACMCGAAHCRGRVATFWELDRKTRVRYRALGIVPDFVLRSRRPAVSARSWEFRPVGVRPLSLAHKRRLAR